MFPVHKRENKQYLHTFNRISNLLIINHASLEFARGVEPDWKVFHTIKKLPKRTEINAQ